MGNRYSFNIEWSKDDQEYVATCPAFPGLSAFGESEEEALREGKVALAGFLETCAANNLPLPEPEDRDTFSGKLQLRLPKSLHRTASKLAQIEDVSLNTYIMDAIRARVSTEHFGGRVLVELRAAVTSALTVRPQGTRYTGTTRESFAHTINTGLERRKNN